MTTKLTNDQRRILVNYAAGVSANEIMNKTGLAYEFVDDTVSDLAKFDRGRAAQLVREHDKTVLARIDTRAATKPAPPAGSPLTINPGAPAHIYALLLDEAEATGERYLVVRVQKVRTLLDEIKERMETTAAERELRAEVARLEAELAAAKAKLRGGKPAREAAEPVPPASVEPSPAELRAWAAERGLDCPAMGRIPKHVREAWDEERAA